MRLCSNENVRESKSLVYPLTRQANVTASDGHVRRHFGTAIGHKGEQTRVPGIRKQHANRTRLVQSTSDTVRETTLSERLST